MRGVLLDSFSVFRGCLSVERPPLNLMCCYNYCGLSFCCSFLLFDCVVVLFMGQGVDWF